MNKKKNVDILGFTTAMEPSASPKASELVVRNPSHDLPTFTKERAEALRSRRGEWMAINEPGITTAKVEAYLEKTTLFVF